MSRTNISTETATLKREGALTWVGVLILEVIMCIVAHYITDIIGECAGLWHHKASLGRDLMWYYGSSLSYADRAAKWFGFRKTWGYFVRAILYEFFSFRLFSRFLGIEFSTNSEDKVSLAGGIMVFGTFVRLAVYTATVFFSRFSSLYGPLHGDWDFEKIYSKIATHDGRWILFWGFICLALAIIMYIFSLQQDNLTIVTCLLIIVGLIAVGTYFNAGNKTCSDAFWDIYSFVEHVGT